MITQTSQIDEIFQSFLENLDEKFNKEKIKKAYEFAKIAHQDQKRKSGEPFLIHPLKVAQICYSYGLDETSIISALLHDIIEDSTITKNKIKEEFGSEVETIVDGLTKIKIYGEKNKEKEDLNFLKKILLTSTKDIRVLMIKLCDVLHNIKTAQFLPLEKRKAYAIKSLFIFAPIAQKIGIYSLKWKIEDFAFKFTDPSSYNYIKKKINMKRKKREKILNIAVEEIKNILIANKITDALILPRPKNFFSIYRKIQNKNKKYEEIDDLNAIRIITKNKKECYEILGIIHNNFKFITQRYKDYITNPKPNGYQSIHTIIYSKTINSTIEIQIRTENMHKIAEFGIAAYWKYKDMVEDKKFERKISWLREIFLWEKEHQNEKDFLKFLKFDLFEQEIMAFTPKNDIIILPEGSTALDFAYAVHTNIGNHAQKAKINNTLSLLNIKIKNSDKVEIITNKNINPTEKWLKMVKSTKAKAKIRDAIKIKHSGKINNKKSPASFEKLKNRIKIPKNHSQIRKAHCCSFAHKDDITGILTKDKILIIHNAKCKNSIFAPQKKIPLFWEEENYQKTTISLNLKDRIGIMIDILNIFFELKTNILELKQKTFRNNDIEIKITINKDSNLEELTKKLKILENLIHIEIQDTE